MADKFERTDRLNEIVDRFFAGQPNVRSDPNPSILLGQDSDPFDTRKLNFHDSKADFLAEFNGIKAALEHAEQLYSFLLKMVKKGKHGPELSGRLAQFLDTSVRQSLRGARIETSIHLARSNNAAIGIGIMSIYALLDLKDSLKKRIQELEDQERNFWAKKNRAPNHYARAIALRFARLVAQRTGKKPTIGTSRDGAHPSTDFGRALEEIFEVLGIKANFKGPGKWAIDQLKEEDMLPPRNPLAGIARGIRPPNALSDIAAAMSKGGDQ